MENCGFPLIPKYLAYETFPEAAIHSASVTHVWSQSLLISKQIADASLIPNIVENLSELIGQVDAVLLARDDAETHYSLAEPFLKAGIPIYIDKPLAYTVSEAQRILDAQQFDGQIFSCSALRYSQTLALSQEDQSVVGDLKYIVGTVPKGWNKYAIHAIEPLRQIIPPDTYILESKTLSSGDVRIVFCTLSNGLEIELRSMGSSPCPISLEIFGSTGYKRLEFTDTFASFKTSLDRFVKSVLMKEPAILISDMLESVRYLELGAL